MSSYRSVFREIMQGYSQRQRERKNIVSGRRSHIYKVVPGYKEADDRIADISTEAAIATIEGDEGAKKRAEEEISRLSAEKEALLKAAGFSSDYLDPPYVCPDCKDTGYIGSEKCHCLKQRLIDGVYSRSDIYPKLSEENFDTFSFEYFSGETLKEMQDIYKLAKNFTDTFANTYSNMLFYGNVGSGKTFVSSCIARELINKGYSVIYVTALRLFELLNAHTFRKNTEEYDEDMYDSLFSCSLLIIDDLGTEVLNSATVISSELFQILNERDNSRRSTIISSNLSLEQLKDNYSERSFSRILGGYELIKFNGNDIRLMKRRQA